MLRFLVVPTALVLLLIAAGCGSDGDSEQQQAGVAATATPAGTPAGGGGGDAAPCEPAQPDEAARMVKLKEPKLSLKPARKYVATVKTNCGEFAFQLDSKRAPKTTGSFFTLVSQKVYDGLTFHRIVPNFVIQGGDPAGDGTGGPGYQITEKVPANLKYEPGTVAMAKMGEDPPGTSGMQFFIVLDGSATQLEPEYAVLGKVTKGMDVVEKIGGQALGENERPVEPVVIRSIRIDG